jgi:hypothetical protein
MEKKTMEPAPVDMPDEFQETQRLHRASLERIRLLQTRSFRGIWALTLFLVVSIEALQDFRHLPAFPRHIKAMLGSPPLAIMISGLLVVYSFSAILLILARMMNGSASSGGMFHVASLSLFYGFYYFSGSLAENFWAVFVAGLTILSLESYQIRIRCTSLISEEQEVLRKLEKKNNKKSHSLP